jgi:hypothetical protein
MASDHSIHPRRPRSGIRKTKPNPPNGNPAHWLLRTSWKEQTQTRATPMPSIIYTRNPDASHREATRLSLHSRVRVSRNPCSTGAEGPRYGFRTPTPPPPPPKTKNRRTKPNSPAGNPLPRPLRTSCTKQTQPRTTPIPSVTCARPRFPLHAFRPRRVNFYVTRWAKGVCLPAAP